jgi:TolA-binding protein
MKFRYVLLMTVFLSGCFLKTRSEISESDDKRTQQQQVTAMQTQKAEEESRVQDLEASLRQMNGRIEALEHRMNMDFENKQRENVGSSQTQKQMIDQMKVFEDTIARLESRVVELESRKSAPVAAGGKAESVLPKSTDSPSYMEAEQLLGQKEWKRAILSYQKYREDNPKGKRFADATYKIGACFQELGKKEEAKAFFEEVIEKFPKSETARKATFRLKNLK